MAPFVRKAKDAARERERLKKLKQLALFETSSPVEQEITLEAVKSEPEDFDSCMDEFQLHEESDLPNETDPSSSYPTELIPLKEVPPSPLPTDFAESIKSEPIDPPSPPVLEIKEEPIDFEYIPASHAPLPSVAPDPLQIQSCLFCFRELAGGLGAALEDAVLRKKIEYVLVAQFNFLKMPCKVPCCISCVQMFDLFYDFKRKCLAALTRQGEMMKAKEPVQQVKPPKMVKVMPKLVEKRVPEVKPSVQVNKKSTELTEVQQLLPELTVAKVVRLKEVAKEKPVSKPVLFFKCPDCPEAFTNEYELSDHAYQHKGISSMNEYFMSKTDGASSPKSCNICSLSFESVKELNAHKVEHAPSVCLRCNGAFALAQDCENHMTVCRGQGNDQQPGSSTSSSHEDNSNSSESTSTDARPCRQCGHLFPVANEVLFQHQTSCGALRSRYKCPRCDKSFALKGTLEAHLKLHDGIRPYRCAKPGCDRTFLSPNACASHEEGCGTLGFVCDICGTTLSTQAGFTMHRAKHGEPKIPCDQCEKRFHNQSALQKHMASHSDERNFECQVCGKRFKSAEANRVHQRIHTKEKPYPCPECGQRFMYNCSLKAHLDKKACIVRGEEESQ